MIERFKYSLNILLNNMKKSILTGLSAVILGSGCAQKEDIQSQQGVGTNVPLVAT